MSDPIVWIISHGGVLDTKLLARKFFDTTLVTKHIVYAQCESSGNKCTFSLQIITNNKLGLSADLVNNDLLLFIASLDKSLSVEQFLEHIDAIKHLPSLDSNRSIVFIDGNIGRPNHPHITWLFHSITNQIGKKKTFSNDFRKVSPELPSLVIYAFSQNSHCCDEANLYLQGLQTPDYIEGDNIVRGFSSSIEIIGFAGHRSVIIRELNSLLENPTYNNSLVLSASKADDYSLRTMSCSNSSFTVRSSASKHKYNLFHIDNNIRLQNDVSDESGNGESFLCCVIS